MRLAWVWRDRPGDVRKICYAVVRGVIMDAKVTWQGRLSFTGSAETGFQLPLGTTPDVGGDNDGFQPMELLAIGLAGCTAHGCGFNFAKETPGSHRFRRAGTRPDAPPSTPKSSPRRPSNIQSAGIISKKRRVVRAIELIRHALLPGSGNVRQGISDSDGIFHLRGFGRRTAHSWSKAEPIPLLTIR